MIEIDDLTIRQGTFSLSGLAFAVPSGRYAVLMGKTGCGKTSVLECLAGLRQPAAGRILLGGRDVTRLRPAERGVGYVPQDGALFSTMTVRDNLQFSLLIRGVDRAAMIQRANELAHWLEIEHLLERLPHGLSGGETQRVALGRALAFRPQVLLLDEPLSSLDEETREQMIDLLQRLHERDPATVLHVTHNRSEAERLGDIVLRLENGAILSEAGTP